MLLSHIHMLFVASKRKKSAVYLGVEGLHATVHHLGKPGVFRYVFYGYAELFYLP